MRVLSQERCRLTRVQDMARLCLSHVLYCVHQGTYSLYRSQRKHRGLLIDCEVVDQCGSSCSLKIWTAPFSRLLMSLSPSSYKASIAVLAPLTERGAGLADFLLNSYWSAIHAPHLPRSAPLKRSDITMSKCPVNWSTAEWLETFTESTSALRFRSEFAAESWERVRHLPRTVLIEVKTKF